MLTTFSTYVSYLCQPVTACLSYLQTDSCDEGNIEWYSYLAIISRVLLSNTLAASKVFSAMYGRVLFYKDWMAAYHITVFDMLRKDIMETFFIIPQLIQGMSTLHRSRPSRSRTHHYHQLRSPSSAFKISCSMYVSSRARVLGIYSSLRST